MKAIPAVQLLVVALLLAPVSLHAQVPPAAPVVANGNPDYEALGNAFQANVKANMAKEESGKKHGKAAILFTGIGSTVMASTNTLVGSTASESTVKRWTIGLSAMSILTGAVTSYYAGKSDPSTCIAQAQQASDAWDVADRANQAKSKVAYDAFVQAIRKVSCDRIKNS